MAKKYIDTDALKIVIKHHIELMGNEPTSYAKARIDEANDILFVIDAFLQQEQPEVDLEKEIDNYFLPIQPWQVQEEPFTSLEKCARYFYELGKAKKEE